MRTKFIDLTSATLISLGAIGFIAWGGSANAQSSCIEQCRSNGWGLGQCRRYCQTRYGEPGRAPRVYGYTSKNSGACGPYHYRKGGRCVDARTTPARGN